MARSSAQTSPAQSNQPQAPAKPVDPVDAFLAKNPEIADEMEGLTRGEKLIRLRQRGLIDFDVQ